MATRNRDAIAELAQMLADGTDRSDDYLAKVIDATVGHDRMLMGLYGLLAAGTIFLLFQAEMSSWAGAALVTAGVLFIVGLAHASMHIVSYHKMLLLADAVKHGEETVDLESGEEEATPEAFFRAEAMARRLHSSESHYLFLGLLCAGAAALIDHWQYAWRAFAVLAGVVVLLLLMELVPAIIKALPRPSAESVEDEAQE